MIFGFDFEDNGTPIKIPHIGKVVIGNNVEIGANTTIAKATFDTTTIKNHVKIDDQVHIAHNCFIDEKTIITAQVILSGSVTIGKKCWIGPNASLIQKIKIEDNVLIGMGATVTKNIPRNSKVMGLNALPLKQLSQFKKNTGYKI